MAEGQKRAGILGLITSNLDTIGVVAKYLIPASLTGAVIGWSTWLTGVFSAAAPASWVYASVTGMFIGVLGTALYAYASQFQF